MLFLHYFLSIIDISNQLGCMRKNGTQVYGAEGGETNNEIYRKYFMLNKWIKLHGV